MMRAKMRVTEVLNYQPSSEIVKMTAVGKSEAYPEDGSDENNSYAKWTPSADLSISIANPALFGKFEVGRQFYLDFTLVEAVPLLTDDEKADQKFEAQTAESESGENPPVDMAPE